MLEEKKSKIKQSVLRTKNRRTKMLCKVIEVKIDNSRINSITRKSLSEIILKKTHHGIIFFVRNFQPDGESGWKDVALLFNLFIC